MLLVAGARAQDVFEPEPIQNRNHFFFHPMISGITLLVPQAPFMAAITYERNLASAGTSLVYQPMIAIGDHEEEDIHVSQFVLYNYLGLRKYFGSSYRGFYVQGSGAFMAGTASAEADGTNDEGSATVTGFGALGYLGYRWTHVYLDLGGGYVNVSGTVEVNDVDEAEVSATGPTIDANLGFGF